MNEAVVVGWSGNAEVSLASWCSTWKNRHGQALGGSAMTMEKMLQGGNRCFQRLCLV